VATFRLARSLNSPDLFVGARLRVTRAGISDEDEKLTQILGVSLHRCSQVLAWNWE
jgi:hypothetical protein